MQRIKLKNKNISDEDLGLVVDYLLKGKIVILPTDTIYGLHCLATSKKAVKQLIKIKRRPDVFGFVHLMKSYCMVHEWCKVSKKQDTYLRKYWPKTTRELQNNSIIFRKRPATYILEAKQHSLGQSREKNGTIAVRLPKHKILIKILKRVNQPLLSSSLNVSGESPANNPKNIEKIFFPFLPDLVLDNGVCKKQKSSIIIDISNINNPKILRK